MHLGMSGSFHVERPAGSAGTAVGGRAGGDADRHDHVVFRMSSGATITFNDPRRFGVMDLVPRGLLPQHAALSAMGPEPLAPAFDAAALARACAGRKTALKVALLDQRVVAGLGNIYVSEALHLARLSPRRRASRIATPSGAPRGGAARLVSAIKTILQSAIDRQTGGDYRSARFRVYDREGQRCPNATLRRDDQAIHASRPFDVLLPGLPDRLRSTKIPPTYSSIPTLRSLDVCLDVRGPFTDV